MLNKTCNCDPLRQSCLRSRWENIDIMTYMLRHCEIAKLGLPLIKVIILTVHVFNGSFLWHSELDINLGVREGMRSRGSLSSLSSTDGSRTLGMGVWNTD